jgi:endoglycosylceramidase
VKGFIWSDAYFLSPAVQRAFDNFWANKPVSDGIGVQDHYANMWKHVASRFAGNKAVIGYDIMNEPFNGTPGTLILPVILTEYARLFAEETGKVLTEPELLGIWSNEESRYEALARLEKIEKYARVISAATELSQEFEKKELHEMYQKVGNAIREVDTAHILFLEHAYFSNAGVSSGVLPLEGRNGLRDPQVAYAAHGYDLLVDTKNYEEEGTGRTAWIFSQIKSTSERTGMPVLVGEWGAFSGNSEAAAKSAVYIRELFDHYHFSHTYWAYHPGVENELYFRKAFIRPCPQLVNGEPLGSAFSPETGFFRFTWRESAAISAPTVIYIPGISGLDRESIRFSPGEGKTEIRAMPSGGGGYLIIPASRKNVDRTLMFNLKSGN